MSKLDRVKRLKFLSKKSSVGQLDSQMAAQTDITDKRGTTRH